MTTWEKPVFSKLDLEMMQRAGAAARPPTAAELTELKILKLPSKIDYSQYVTLIREQGGGGCGTMASLAILDILKEREHPFSPDFSYGFAEYIYNKKHIGQLDVLKKYGCCPEAVYPTNYDRGPMQEPSPLQYQEAAAYKIKGYGHPITYGSGSKSLSPDLIRGYLMKYGPVWGVGAVEYRPELGDEWYKMHVFAIVGYDDNAREFTIVNSYGDTWGSGGFVKCPYPNVSKKLHKHVAPTISYVQYVENEPHPIIHPYIVRVRTRGQIGRRRNLTIRVGVERQGLETQTPKVIWDRNNHYEGLSYDNIPVHNCANIYDRCISLGLDAPIHVPVRLPYGPLWPPSWRHLWYIEVNDHSILGPGIAGNIEEIVFADRFKHTLTKPTYPGPYPIPLGGTVRVYIPVKINFSIMLRVDTSSVPYGKQVTFTGKLTSLMQRTSRDQRVVPIANKQVNIHHIKNGHLQPAIATVHTDNNGDFLAPIRIEESSVFQARYFESDPSWSAWVVSNHVSITSI